MKPQVAVNSCSWQCKLDATARPKDSGLVQFLRLLLPTHVYHVYRLRACRNFIVLACTLPAAEVAGVVTAPCDNFGQHLETQIKGRSVRTIPQNLHAKCFGKGTDTFEGTAMDQQGRLGHAELGFYGYGKCASGLLL